MSNEAKSVTAKPVSRRKVMGGMAVVSAASTGMGGFSPSALAAGLVGERELNIHKGRYAVSGNRVIDGYFASPRGKTDLGVVLIMPQGESLDAQAENEARLHAMAGYIAIVPDLKKSTGSLAALGGRDAMVTEMLGAVPDLKRLSHSNGKVSVVAAGNR